MRQFDYYSPDTIEEALSLLSRYKGEAKLLAGGTDLIGNLKRREIKPKVLIDIKKIKGLNKILCSKKNGLRVGALVTLTRLHTSEAVRDNYPFLAQAAGEVGSVQVRNRATLGGNLCNASPAADMGPPLVAMGAVAVLKGRRKERETPLEKFFTGPGTTGLKDGEIFVRIEAPALKAHSGGAYIKLGVRRAMEIALVGVAAMVRLDGKNGTVKDVRITLGAVAPTIIRAEGAEELVIGSSLDEEVLQAAGQAASKATKPISDVRCSADYRKDMANVLTRRALKIAYQAAQAS